MGNIIVHRRVENNESVITCMMDEVSWVATMAAVTVAIADFQRARVLDREQRGLLGILMQVHDAGTIK